MPLVISDNSLVITPDNDLLKKSPNGFIRRLRKDNWLCIHEIDGNPLWRDVRRPGDGVKQQWFFNDCPYKGPDDERLFMDFLKEQFGVELAQQICLAFEQYIFGFLSVSLSGGYYSFTFVRYLRIILNFRLVEGRMEVVNSTSVAILDGENETIVELHNQQAIFDLQDGKFKFRHLRIAELTLKMLCAQEEFLVDIEDEKIRSDSVCLSDDFMGHSQNPSNRYAAILAFLNDESFWKKETGSFTTFPDTVKRMRPALNSPLYLSELQQYAKEGLQAQERVIHSPWYKVNETTKCFYQAVIAAKSFADIVDWITQQTQSKTPTMSVGKT